MASSPKSAPPATPAPVRTELSPTGDSPQVAYTQLPQIGEALQAGNRAKALAIAKGLEPAAAHSADLSDQLADFYKQTGVLDRSLPLARQAVALAPKSPLMLLHLGEVELLLGYASTAGEHLHAAQELAPNASEIALARARFQEYDLQLAEAERSLRHAVALEPQNVTSWRLLVSNLTRQQKFADARTALERADQLAPDAPQNLLQHAQLSWEELRRGIGEPGLKRAEIDQWLQKCLAAVPGLPAALYAQGLLRIEEGDDAGAVAVLEEALKRAPGMDGLKIHLGQALVRRGERARGTQLIQEHWQAKERQEQLERQVRRVAMHPDDLAMRQELIRWCRSQGMEARAQLEESELRRYAGSRTTK